MKNLGMKSEAPSAKSNGGKRPYDLSERFLEFAATVVKLTYSFPKTGIGKHVGMQLIRSATSMGANYEEGCAAQSRADFIHKLQIVFKETRESIYWMRLSEKLDLVNVASLVPVLQEGKELELIIGKSLVTSKGI